MCLHIFCQSTPSLLSLNPLLSTLSSHSYLPISPLIVLSFPNRHPLSSLYPLLSTYSPYPLPVSYIFTHLSIYCQSNPSSLLLFYLHLFPYPSSIYVSLATVNAIYYIFFTLVSLSIISYLVSLFITCPSLPLNQLFIYPLPLSLAIFSPDNHSPAGSHTQLIVSQRVVHRTSPSVSLTCLTSSPSLPPTALSRWLYPVHLCQRRKTAR